MTESLNCWGISITLQHPFFDETYFGDGKRRAHFEINPLFKVPNLWIAA
jgi:hypothetical protein